MRGHAVEIGRFRVVETPLRHAHVDLVRLLVVLVEEEIGRACRRQRVVGEQFEPIGQRNLAEDLEQFLHRVHVFHHAAEFRAVGRATAVFELAEVLVARVAPADLAEPLLAPRDSLEGRRR